MFPLLSGTLVHPYRDVLTTSRLKFRFDGGKITNISVLRRSNLNLMFVEKMVTKIMGSYVLHRIM